MKQTVNKAEPVKTPSDEVAAKTKVQQANKTEYKARGPKVVSIYSVQKVSR